MCNQMFGHLQKLSQDFSASGKQGEIITRMTNDISGVQSIDTGTLTQAASNLAVLISSFIAIIQLNWILALISMFIVPLIVFPVKIVGKKMLGTNQ